MWYWDVSVIASKDFYPDLKLVSFIGHHLLTCQNPWMPQKYTLLLLSMNAAWFCRCPCSQPFRALKLERLKWLKLQLPLQDCYETSWMAQCFPVIFFCWWQMYIILYTYLIILYTLYDGPRILFRRRCLGINILSTSKKNRFKTQIWGQVTVDELEAGHWAFWSCKTAFW